MKTIKISSIAVILLAVASVASAQDDKFGPNKEECLKYLSYYEEYYKQKAYDEALPNWRQAYKFCPAASRQTMLINGTTMYRRLIMKYAKDEAYKKALLDTLFTLHSQRAEFFPKYKAAALNAMGQDAYNFLRSDIQKQFEKINEIIDANQAATKPTLLVHSFNAAVTLFQKGAISAEELLNVYQKNADVLALMEASEEVSSAKGELESRFVASGVATCQNLLALLEPKFKANPEDAKLTKNIVRFLSNADDCTDNDLFLNAVTTLHKLEPSHNSAYYLYRLNSSRGNVAEAISYLKAAIEDEGSDAKTDADYSFQLAAYSLKNGQTAQAIQYAFKASELDPAFAGKAYMLAGQIWGSTNCGGDEISRRAPYWVAVDYMVKARNADASLAEDAAKFIATYSKYYPETGEAFMYGLSDGQSYNVNCAGMHATTTVRTQKQ